ncbi:MAG: TIGR02117 family protein [Alphaproteobacteria bacterium]|nr:TIGR02117 family protein [Alphaproteobacteria bacterium]
MTAIRRLGRWLGWLALALGLPPVLYVAAALVLSRIPVNADFVPVEIGVQIGVIDNGAHTDLILPVDAAGIDWRRRFPPTAFPGLRNASWASRYLSIGWGHREFYLTTPTWAETRPWTALKAILGLGGTVLRVSYWPSRPGGRGVVWVGISEAAYLRLAAYVEGSLTRDGAGRAIAVMGAGYRSNDAFFLAEGRFGPFNTCNEWSRQALAQAGVRTALWSPLPGPLLEQLRDISVVEKR